MPDKMLRGMFFYFLFAPWLLFMLRDKERHHNSLETNFTHKISHVPSEQQCHEEDEDVKEMWKLGLLFYNILGVLNPGSLIKFLRRSVI